MKITLESTGQIVELNGIQARVWQGTTESGVPLTAFIPRVAVHPNYDQSQFERELIEQREPRASGPVWPARMVL
jgi:hypothetical protein